MLYPSPVVPQRHIFRLAPAKEHPALYLNQSEETMNFHRALGPDLRRSHSVSGYVPSAVAWVDSGVKGGSSTAPCLIHSFRCKSLCYWSISSFRAWICYIQGQELPQRDVNFTREEVVSTAQGHFWGLIPI